MADSAARNDRIFGEPDVSPQTLEDGESSVAFS